MFLRYTEGRSVLCIMPINTLQNWVAEFNMWLPVDPETSPLKEQGEVSSRHFPIFVLNDNQKSLTARAKVMKRFRIFFNTHSVISAFSINFFLSQVIQNWYKEGGVLLIGYELYRQLCLKKSPKARLRSKKKEIEEDIGDEKSKSLLDSKFELVALVCMYCSKCDCDLKIFLFQLCIVPLSNRVLILSFVTKVTE